MDPTALGRYLRESREAKELTLEDAVRNLRIRREIFESFEQGNFNVADSPVRIRGMLRNYARFLGLEEERVLQYYEAAEDEKRRIHRRFGRRKTRTEPIAARNITDTPPSLPAVTISSRRRLDFASALRNIAFFLGSLAAIAVIFFVIYNMLDLGAFGEKILEVPSLAIGSSTATPTNTPSITPSTLIASSTPDNFARGIVSVAVSLEMTQRSWVHILVDDTEIFSGILEPQESMQLEGSQSVQIAAANAAGLHIIYNGIEQDLFGGRGQQVDLRFGLNGIEASLGEGDASPPQQINLVSPTPFILDATAETNSTLPTDAAPTALISALESPTPFLVDNTVLPTATALAQANASLETTETLQNSVTQSATLTATLTPRPSATATAMLILPLRETANPTATKTN
jgi:hypothetical protein